MNFPTCCEYGQTASKLIIYFQIIFPVLLEAILFFIYKLWVKRGLKFKQCDPRCPSHKLPPKARSWEEHKNRTILNSLKHDKFRACTLLDGLVRAEQKKATTPNRQRRTLSLLPTRSSKNPGNGSLSKERANTLDMDHIHLDYFQFLWSQLFIAPSVWVLYKMGEMKLVVRSFLVKHDIIKTEPLDIEVVIGKLCLEQSQVINYAVKIKSGGDGQEEDGDTIGGFFFPDFPYIDNSYKFRVADLLTVEINLVTKRFVRARMDGDDLTASQVLILLSFNTISAQHVKLHSFANWGLNSHNAIKNSNPFLHRNSVATITYNDLGYNGFVSLLDTLAKDGKLLSKDWIDSSDALLSVFDHGIKQNVPQHSHIYQLVPYSRFVNFIVKVRAIFFQEFVKHKESFPGVDPEAMFLGTVLHSLDHTFFEWNLKDPLWASVEDPKFGKMAEIVRLVRSCFVEDLPGIYFHKRFKGSGEPFYEAVYRKAAKIDKELADNMDTCIIK